jgi:hypothetical protein
MNFKKMNILLMIEKTPKKGIYPTNCRDRVELCPTTLMPRKY